MSVKVVRGVARSSRRLLSLMFCNRGMTLYQQLPSSTGTVGIRMVRTALS